MYATGGHDDRMDATGEEDDGEIIPAPAYIWRCLATASEANTGALL
jgi:hypothetical protein